MERKYRISGLSSAFGEKRMNLDYTLLRSRKRKKTICLQLRNDGRMIIRAPFFTPEREIDYFFRSREEWLKQRIREKESRTDRKSTPKTFQNGELFLFLGTRYPLRITASETHPRGRPLFDDRHIILQRDDADQGREILTAWYMEQAETHFGQRLDFFSRQLNLVPTGFRITGARSFWGSCSASDRLAFNWRLIMAPRPVIDYVIVHELQHIVEKKHSVEFWKRVAAVIPDHRERRGWLRKNGSRLNL